ncbi:MAG TPA: 2,3-diphosphoglycerate synthetase [Actinomycetota bacterium]|nr:2,3-diphosphoglycerate synthetase [Actinomycetota bacterium]
MKVLVLVDGEHYPPVTRWAIASATAAGHQVLAALLVGGTEKLAADEVPDLGVDVRPAVPAPAEALGTALDELRPEGVLDLSDEPVLGYRERMELAAVALARGVPYLGADFRLDPPISGPHLPAPTLAVIGTGKRTGKTAIAGEVARTAAGLDLEPIVVAMGRGGPAAPQVAEAGSVTVDRLLDLVRRGEHAASDYLEDAVTTGVTTIGARRAAGGLAGAPYVSTVRAAAELAVARGAGIVVLEGSGSSIPPVPWDAGILVVPATVPPEYLGGYLGPFRLLLSDVVVATMATSPAGLENLPTLRSHVQRLRNDARLIVTEFEPLPLGDVRGRDVFFATTAPGQVASRQAQHLEEAHGCRVVGWTAGLADRAGLAKDMEGAPEYDVLLTELKAAAVDVACDRALGRGAEVVFCDNRAVVVDGDPDDLSAAIRQATRLAEQRHQRRQ